jgi:hypothetical protein
MIFKMILAMTYCEQILEISEHKMINNDKL